MDNILVSIIIPVFNVEKYLSSCIDSALIQTYKYIEIILIDDGSTDNSPSICDLYAHKYSNIKSYHKKNGGLSDARNLGITVSNGEYIIFLDSDDQLESDAITKMLFVLEKTNTDIVIPDRYLKIYEETNKSKLVYHFKINQHILPAVDFATNIIISKGRAWRASAVLYKRSIITKNKIIFPVGYISEDIIFNLEYLSKIKNVAIYNGVTLKNLKRRGSITSSFQETYGEVFLYIDSIIETYFKNISSLSETNNTKRKMLLCRNTIVFLSNIFSKECMWPYNKKVSISKQYLLNNRIKEAFNTKSINPYFNNYFKTLYFKIMFYLIKYNFYSQAFEFSSFVNRIKSK